MKLLGTYTQTITISSASPLVRDIDKSEGNGKKSHTIDKKDRGNGTWVKD